MEKRQNRNLVINKSTLATSENICSTCQIILSRDLSPWFSVVKPLWSQINTFIIHPYKILHDDMWRQTAGKGGKDKRLSVRDLSAFKQTGSALSLCFPPSLYQSVSLHTHGTSPLNNFPADCTCARVFVYVCLCGDQRKAVLFLASVALWLAKSD